MGRVVVMGYLSIDQVTQPDGTRRAQPGGAALYAALGARALGAEVAMLAAAGEDWPEAWHEEARRCGIDCAGVERRAGASRRARLDYAADGARGSTHHDEEEWWARTAALLPPLPARLGPDDVLVLAPMPAAQAARALDAAGPCRTVADTSEAFARRDADALRALLPRLALFAPSRAESRWLMPMRGCPIVEKRGAEGLALLSPEGAAPEIFAAPTVVVRDATGAGDATVGAIAAGLAAGDTLWAALHAAVMIGARTVTGDGPAALGFHA